MRGDGVLNLLIFQAFQDVRMASSLVRSTTFNTRVFNDSGFFIASRHFTLFIKKEHIWSTKTKNFYIRCRFIQSFKKNFLYFSDFYRSP